MLRFSAWVAGAAAAVAGLGAAGCGFVPGLAPWFDTRSCLVIGFVAGKIIG